jgi:hypothetical protein
MYSSIAQSLERICDLPIEKYDHSIQYTPGDKYAYIVGGSGSTKEVNSYCFRFDINK